MPSVVLPLLLAVAVIGYLAGLHRPQRSPVLEPAGATEVASGPGLLLEHPRGWVRSETGPSIPGLSLSGSLWLTPAGGNPGQAGLLSGTLDTPGIGPVPGALLGRLGRAPRTEVVNLNAMQAFRFPELAPAGLHRTVDLYVVPTPGRNPTALACYAPAPGAQALGECDRIAATLTLVGQAAEDLTPDPTYGQGLTAVIARLADRPAGHRAGRPRSPGSTSLLTAVRSAAARYAAAAKALAALEPPPVAATAQLALTRAIRHAGLAYRGLARAAGSGSAAGYRGSHARLIAAEAGLRDSLRSFALLGYGRSGGDR